MRVQRRMRSTGVLAAVFSLVLTAMIGLIPSSASATPAYYLAPGTKLTVGHCLTSTSNYGTAKLCMRTHGNVVTYYKGKVVDTWGANSRANTVPQGYLTTTASGYIRIYQYSGGPLIWHYDKFATTGFRNLGVEISSFSLGAGWCTYVSDLKTYKYPFRGPKCVTG
jgi:hypothetical protein